MRVNADEQHASAGVSRTESSCAAEGATVAAGEADASPARSVVPPMGHCAGEGLRRVRRAEPR